MTTHQGATAAVLDVIRACGTTSRADLVHVTGLTGATISTAVRRLIDDGLVIETGRAESTGGKPRVLLQLNHAARFAIGVHLDHSGIVYVLTTLGGTVIGRMSRAGAGVGNPPTVIARMAQEVDALIDGSGVDRDRVLGLGLVSPGPLTPAAGMRLTPPAMRQWEDFPLDRAVHEAVGVPVLLDNDATAAALGEHWTGRAGPRSTFAAVYMGTGVGAGLIINGAAYGGVSGNAGEIGHMCLDPDGPECWCGARGCTEALGGPARVVAAACDDHDLRRRAGLDGQPAENGRAEVAGRFAAVARLALRGDTRARELLEDSARYVGLATRALANVMDVDLVILTGPSMAVAGSVYVPVVQAELDRSFFSRSTHGVRVMVSASARTSAAIGAAAMVLQSHLVPHSHGPALPLTTARAQL
ncbi:ROK family transcriptional regulator [Cellulomonas bogoriensis]|uniref:ROK family transcriptional regulator n=1 Tax=Cellulomonas bogoriensis TaxID=301388 RepID=UPI001E3A6DC7|nr:ROK family transcriptional regulator [Cellulomonas bogoriensis]